MLEMAQTKLEYRVRPNRTNR